MCLYYENLKNITIQENYIKQINGVCFNFTKQKSS